MRRLNNRPHKSRIPMRAALLLALLLFLSSPALAINSMDTERQNSLTIRLTAEGQPVSGVTFKLYRVANVSESAEYTLTGKFRDYPVDLNRQSAEDWRKLSSTLAAYAAADELSPSRTLTTDENGTACEKGLRCGLYLAVGQPYEADGRRYAVEAALISLPGKNTADEWTYDVLVQPKQEELNQDTASLEVMKIWKDEDADDRPAKITVQLLCDGKAYEEIALNQDNNWRYEWTDLDGSKLWQVIERPVPDGYHVDIDRDGALTVITNTRSQSGESGGGEGGRLPQTGLNWTPIWAAGAAGALLFIVGWIRQKQNGGMNKRI